MKTNEVDNSSKAKEVSKIIFGEQDWHRGHNSKKGCVVIGYGNDYPMQHGDGESYIIPNKLMDFVLESQRHLTRVKELEEELDKLKNPWISVENLQSIILDAFGEFIRNVYKKDEATNERREFIRDLSKNTAKEILSALSQGKSEDKQLPVPPVSTTTNEGGGMSEYKIFTAQFAYKKDGHQQQFTAKTKGQAEQMAREYANKENKGEPKSERLRFIKIINP